MPRSYDEQMQLRHQETEELQVNDMNSSKNRNGIVIVLLALVVAVWGFAIAGWVNGYSDSFSLFKKSNSDTLERKIIGECTPLALPRQTPPPEELDETAPLETPEQTPPPQELDETAPLETPDQTPPPRELKASGV